MFRRYFSSCLLATWKGEEYLMKAYLSGNLKSSAEARQQLAMLGNKSYCAYSIVDYIKLSRAYYEKQSPKFY